VPLSDLRRHVLGVLAKHRNPESYVSGAAPLARIGPRISDHIDIFHDREEAIAAATEQDVRSLEAAGFQVRWHRREPGLHSAVILRDGASMRLEWARDSDFRFFPAVPDALFGYVLHVLDIAVNKALAAAGRREPRDIIDLLFIDENELPLGAVIWAAVGKDPGFTPEGLIDEIRRNARFRQDDYDDLSMEQPVDAADVSRRLRAALDRAEAFVRAMPAGKEGLLFLKDGMAVQPDPARVDDSIAHGGRRRGHWPSSPELAQAMLERYAPKT